MTNPKDVHLQEVSLDENPFIGYKIKDGKILKQLEGRHPCPQCGKSRKYFCYTCYVPISEISEEIPLVRLPIKIDIIKHRQEIDGKSTASHAAILAPLDVSIYMYPDIPDYSDEKAVLIYPSHNALSITQLLRQENYEELVDNLSKESHKKDGTSTLMKTSSQNFAPLYVNNRKNLTITKAIFIDSTWNQSKSIYKDTRLKKLPCLAIQSRISQFWRHQKGSPRWYLATIEAIHQFLIELHIHLWGMHPSYDGIYNCFTEKVLNDCECLYKNDTNSYNGQYDNLLYFFKHMYELIHEYYDHDDLHAYKRRLL